ncbi:hypothetical protein JHK82_016017 [Glycine max]|nr:hypothetical protein JHK82_016017 [Glycine max]
MTSSSVNAIVYYNAAIITTKHDSTFVRSSPKIIELDNKMSLDALKKAIGNKISLPNGKVVNDIHFLLPVSFVGDCGQCRACMLNDGEDIMTMFSMFKQISKLTCLELYITTAYTPTQTCAHPPPISARSLNLGGLDEYLDDTLNLESNSQAFDATEDQPHLYSTVLEEDVLAEKDYVCSLQGCLSDIEGFH